ncbi:MAG TPA: transposase [Cyanobacteria bacterium UBA8543]|nr:transposase [Cyanobacteria bacterium UBA8543]
MLAIKRELKLNNKQRTLMAQHAGYSRVVYNYGLSLYSQIDHNEFKGGVSKKIGAIKKVLTNCTSKQPEFAWMKKLSSKVYQSALQDLQNAFNRFFQGLGKYPAFKRKKDKASFTVYSGNGVVVLAAGRKIKIPTLLTFTLKESLDSRYVTQTFTLSRLGDRWFVAFSVNALRIPPLFHEKTKVGIDLGVKRFATLSDGTIYDAPKPMKKAKTKLGKLQWRNRNKQLGNRRQGISKSKNAAKYYVKLGNQHAQISNQRKDFLHKTTTEISRTYATIRIEDLNISGMIANHKLSAAISDLGFYEFRRQLVYKQAHYGTKVELVDRWYPSSKTCSRCGHIQSMPLRERVFNCQECGFQIDRDLNASLNLENAPEDKVGRASSELNACGEVSADTPRKSRKRTP